MENFDAMFAKADEIVSHIMNETADMNENEFLAMLGLLIKVYTVEKKTDIEELVSKLFIGIAQTEGYMLRMMSDEDEEGVEE